MTDADVAVLKMVARKRIDFRVHTYLVPGTWYVMADGYVTSIEAAPAVIVACHPDDEQQLRDLIAVAQEHAL
jgi:hypothetical protein